MKNIIKDIERTPEKAKKFIVYEEVYNYTLFVFTNIYYIDENCTNRIIPLLLLIIGTLLIYQANKINKKYKFVSNFILMTPGAFLLALLIAIIFK